VCSGEADVIDFTAKVPLRAIFPDLEADDDSWTTPNRRDYGPRPGSRTFLVVTADYEHSQYTRVELDLGQVLDEEVREWKKALEWARSRGIEPEDDDRAIWSDGRLVAVIRPGPDGEPTVIRLDGEGSTDADRS
jgi:hypothetical protein